MKEKNYNTAVKRKDRNRQRKIKKILSQKIQENGKALEIGFRK